jgi:hypothetical protein
MSSQSDTMSPQSSECSSDNFNIEDLFAQTDLSKDIPFDFTLIYPLVPSDTMSLQSDTMSPQSSECSSDNFSVEDLFSQTDLSQNIPFDFTSNYPLVLTLNGSYLSPPVDWLSEGLNAGEQVDVERNTSGVHTFWFLLNYEHKSNSIIVSFEQRKTQIFSCLFQHFKHKQLTRNACLS